MKSGEWATARLAVLRLCQCVSLTLQRYDILKGRCPSLTEFDHGLEFFLAEITESAERFKVQILEHGLHGLNGFYWVGLRPLLGDEGESFFDKRSDKSITWTSQASQAPSGYPLELVRLPEQERDARNTQKYWFTCIILGLFLNKNKKNPIKKIVLLSEY